MRAREGTRGFFFKKSRAQETVPRGNETLSLAHDMSFPQELVSCAAYPSTRMVVTVQFVTACIRCIRHDIER